MKMSKSPSAEAAATRAFLVEFFDFIKRAEWGQAEERIAREAFPHGAEGGPSPRAEVYIATGEWDEERTAVPLRLVGLNVCGCRIGTTEPVKVCVLDAQVCTIAKHKKPILQRGGWMIAAGPKVGDGVYSTLALPVHEQGGPIDALTARQLADPIRPFMLRIPLWKFVFQAFHEDLLGLMDSPQKPLKRSSFEKLGTEALDGAPVFPLSAGVGQG
jgi:hypothetical protein